MTVLFRIAAVGVGLSVGVCGLLAQEKTASLPAVLEKAGAFLAGYQREVSAVVSEEVYDQTARSEARGIAQRRRTRSDVLVLANDATGWVVLRDVFEVDGKALRDRDERLERLILRPDADTFRQARRIAEESARFNVSFSGRPFTRTLNNPMAALRFLVAPHQHRSRFKIERTTVVDGVSEIELSFDEQKKPRILASPNEAAGSGRFWIDAASGRILRSEVKIQTGLPGAPILSMIKVTFAVEPRIALSVPVAMEETYQMGGANPQRIDARATYTTFRKFSVDVSTILKPGV